MKAEKTEKGVTVEFSDDDVKRLTALINSYDSDRVLRQLGDQLLNLFYSINKK